MLNNSSISLEKLNTFEFLNQNLSKLCSSFGYIINQL